MSDTYTDITVHPPGYWASRDQQTADTGEGGWGAFPEAQATSAHSWDDFPEAGGLKDSAVDAGKSLGTGIVKGTAALGGLVGDLSKVGAHGLDLLNQKLGLERTDIGIPEGVKEGARNALSYIPTQEGIVDFIESHAGKLHQPHTTAGDYAEKIGEYVPALIGSPGGVARKVAQAVIPGSVDESARKLTKGTDFENYAGPIAGALAGGAVALASRPGSAAQAIRAQLPENLSNSDINAASQLIRDAEGRGIQLTWPEALSQVTKKPVLTDTQRILESSPETRARMQEFFSDRPRQFDQAALDEFQNIAPGTAQPSSIGRQASEAAQGHLTDVRQTINRASDPFYKNAESVVLSPQEMAHVRSIPGFDQALKAVRDNPQINWRIAHLPDESVGVLNEVKKHFDQAAENAGSKFNPAKNQQVKATNEMAADTLKQIGETKSPDYAIALGIQAQAREKYLQPLLDGPLGRIANKPDTRKAIDALFPQSPLPNSHIEIADAVGALAKKNPYAATQLVRAHLESTFNEATRLLQGGPNQFGAANFAKAIVGNPQQRENLRAAIEALPNGQKLWSGFDGFLQAAEATGMRQQKGSLTAFNAADRKLMEGSSPIGEAVKTGLSPGKWWSIVNDKWSKWKLGNNLNELATIFTNPASGKIMARIAKMPRGSREAQFLVGRLIAQTEQAVANSREPRR